MPRISYYLGRWIRGTDWYPDYQLRLYDRRVGRFNGKRVHESVELKNGRPGRSSTTSSTIPTATSPTTSPASITTRRSPPRSGIAEGRRTNPLEVAIHPPAAFLRNYIVRRRLSRRDGGVSDLDPQLVLRLPEDPEALGAAARLSHAGPGRGARREQRATPSEVRAHTQRRRPKSARRRQPIRRPRHGGDGWCAGRPSTRLRPPAVDVLAPHRHGANVAWWSESGARHRPRAASPRASDDARRASRRRASPARARGPGPHSARAEDRDGSQRGLAPVAPPQAAQARHRPRPRPARRRDGRAGALDEHAAGQAAARRVAPRRLPPAQQCPVALEVPAGRLLHLRVGSDSTNARGRRRAGGADGDRSRRHRPRAYGVGAARQPARRAVPPPSGAARRQRRRPGAAQRSATLHRSRRARRAQGRRTRAS